MPVLVLGLVIFLGVHSLPMAVGLRQRLIGRLGESTYRGLYAVVALLGLVLIVWGYGLARFNGSPALWDPPVWTRHLAVALMLPAFVLLVAAYVPGRIKATLKHPMLAGVKLWAFAHLIANGTVADVVLFGAVLGWAIVDRISVKRREAGLVARVTRGARRLAAVRSSNDLVALAIGAALWLVFLLWLHRLLFGVSPLG